jgi:hypothetical protein
MVMAEVTVVVTFVKAPFMMAYGMAYSSVCFGLGRRDEGDSRCHYHNRGQDET